MVDLYDRYDALSYCPYELYDVPSMKDLHIVVKLIVWSLHWRPA